MKSKNKPRKTSKSCRPYRKPPAQSEQRHQAFVWLTFALTWCDKSAQAAPPAHTQMIVNIIEEIHNALDTLKPGSRPDGTQP